MESSLGLTSLRKVINVGESYNSFDDLPSLSLNCQGQGDDVSPIGPIVKKPTYLQALLGDNPPKLGGFEHASLIKSTYHPSCETDDIPSSQFKIPSLVMSSTGGSVVSRLVNLKTMKIFMTYFLYELKLKPISIKHNSCLYRFTVIRLKEMFFFNFV